MSAMTESGTGEGGGFKARAGALTLFYLTSPMDRGVLLTMLAEATTGVQMLDELDIPEPDDARDVEKVLNDPYLVEPADPNLGPGSPIGPDTMLQPTPAGREVPFVGAVLQHWLDLRPYGPVELGPEAAPSLSALLIGWTSTALHALAAQPLTAAEVCEAIQVLDLETVEARIDSMEEAGMLEVLESEDGEERFAATEWLRMGIAPLAAAARLELRHPPGDTAPIAALDVEAAFLLTLPLLELPPELSGSCSLAVELEESVSGSPTGVTVRVEKGEVVSCEVGLDEETDARASASAADWLDTVIEPDAKLVEIEGESRVARTLLHELHQTLFGETIG
jgi:hypothetical protein